MSVSRGRGFAAKSLCSASCAQVLDLENDWKFLVLLRFSMSKVPWCGGYPSYGGSSGSGGCAAPSLAESALLLIIRTFSGSFPTRTSN